MESRVRTLQLRIERIKRELCEIGELRPGVLSKQYNVCGQPSCRCKADPPRKHGPYYQLAWARHGRNTTRFIRESDAPRVRKELKNYERLQTLVDKWIGLSLELCEIRLKQRRAR
jgi:hypothetical protein